MESIQKSDLAGLAVRFVSLEPARDISLQHIFKVVEWVSPFKRVSYPFPFRRGSTALHILAIFGLSQLADVNPYFWTSIYQEDGYSNRHFKYAIMSGNSQMCHFMLDVYKILEVCALVNGSPIVWSRDALQYAAWLDWPLLIKRLIELGLDKNAATGTWDPPLHVAARNGSSLALEALLKAGVDPNIVTEDKETPLTFVTAKNRKDMVALLVENGADVKVKSGPRDQTPLHIAAGEGNVEIARLVLEHGCDVNALDSTGLTPVNQAAMGGNIELTKMLMYEYKTDLTTELIDGCNLLHLAVSGGNCELVSLFLDLGVKPIVTSEYEHNILYAAVAARSVGMLKMLLERFPDIDPHAVNTYGETPLHFAARRYLEGVQYLLKVDPSLATVCSASAGLPIHSAVYGGRMDCAEVLITSENINAEGPEGRTPLIEAARSGRLSFVELLIRKGADVNKADINGETPLLAAAAKGHLPVVDYLVEHGVDISKTDSGNVGLLFSLLLEGHFSAADCLFRKGIEADLVVETDVTPLLFAGRLNCIRVTRRLLDLSADHMLRWKINGQIAFMRAVCY